MDSSSDGASDPGGLDLPPSLTDIENFVIDALNNPSAAYDGYDVSCANVSGAPRLDLVDRRTGTLYCVTLQIQPQFSPEP